MMNKVNTISIGPFDIYNSIDDRIALKNKVKDLFSIDDEVFFYSRREEDLTSNEELASLRKVIFKYIEPDISFKYLFKLDDRRFDAIARVKVELGFPNFVLDMMKYFYACNFFKPINDLTFDEYEDYLMINGFDDINGIKMIRNQLADFICIKGLGADHLIISYNETLELESKLSLNN